jgi:hypothetical protein
VIGDAGMCSVAQHAARARDRGERQGRHLRMRKSSPAARHTSIFPRKTRGTPLALSPAQARHPGGFMPQRFRDYGLAAVMVAALFGALTCLDGRVPQRVTSAIDSVASGRWATPGTAFGSMMWDVTSSPVLGNYFVVGMLAAGVVLVFLMVRT